MTSRTSFPRSLLRQLLPTPKSSPVSIALTVLVAIGAVLARVPTTQRAVHSFGAFTWDQLSAGRIWTPFTALIVPGRAGALLFDLIVLVMVLPSIERRMGSRRLVGAYAGIGAFSLCVGGAIVAVLARVGEPWAKSAEKLLVGDPSVGLIAVISVALASASVVWRHRGMAIVGAYVIVMLLYSGQPSDIARGVAFLGGVAVGEAMSRGRTLRKTEHFYPTGHEVRVLASSIVAIVALGPVVSALSRASMGILSPSLVLIDDAAEPAVHRPCSGVAFGKACGDWLVWGLQAHERTAAWLQLLPVVLLIMAAYAMFRGRRSGMWVSTVLLFRNALSVTLVFSAHPVIRQHRGTVTALQVELAVQVALVVAINVGIAVWLIRERRAFTVRMNTRGAALGWLLALLTLSVTACAVALLPMARQANHSAAKGLWRGFALSLPPAARYAIGAGIRTVEPAQHVLYLLLEALMWAMLLTLAYRSMYAGLWREGPTESQIRERLRIGGGTHISFMATWPGNHHWQDPVTGAIVAYRDAAGIALTLSEPFGAPHADLLGIVTRFHQFADTRGLTPVWYSVDAQRFTPIAQRLGGESIEVAQESVVNVQAWRTVGKAWQDVRSALSRAKREGISATWLAWRDMTVGAYADVVALSQDWVSGHPLPEMGFTLGGLDELRDPDVRLMVATNASGRVVGVLSWLPTWRDGRIIGWTLDFMRRSHDSMPGLIEFLIAQSAITMKDAGVEFMSLSGAPLAGHSEDKKERNQLDDLLTYVSGTLEPVYGFQSLHRFKQKFQPEAHSWTMVFPSALNLPAIGLAVTRSYLPNLSPVAALNAVRSLVSSR